ncbi:hypothetical protein ACLIMP_00270 [Novosphingobium aerophilum]|uniref:hypothetical protein n=1 Tax=Novosphingobium aerophilum TaxID=2839843 RepID=UPI003FD0443A
MIKRIVIGLVALVVGTGVGVGGAYAARQFLPQVMPDLGPVKVETEFVPTGTMLAPLTFPDGRLAGYVSFECQVEVVKGKAEDVTGQLPLLLNAVNMRTYRTPLASGPDGMIPSVDAFRRLVMDAAVEVYGKDLVRRVVVTQAAPV